MIHHFRRLRLALAVAALLLLSGCYAGSVDQYFALPRPSDETVQLQALIDAELADGNELTAPVGGSYRQSVQLFDPDKDGRTEALVFFRDREGQTLLRLYRSEQGAYHAALALPGNGSTVGSVDYADLDRDGMDELIVLWQAPGGMNTLSVHRLRGWSGDTLLSTECVDYALTDLSRDGYGELILLRSAGTSYLADMYSFTDSGEARATTAALSAEIDSIRRMRVVRLSDDAPSLLVESSLADGNLVTDLLLCRDGSLINLTLNRATGISGTRRSYSLAYAQDINGDGVVDIPLPRQLQSGGNEVFWAITWYDYDSGGRTNDVLTTYHNFSDGWYLVLPEAWEELTVRRNNDPAGVHSLTLCLSEADGSTKEMITVAALTGESRYERSREEGRFVLTDSDSAIFTAAIHDNSITKDTLLKSFHLIHTEWSTGSV